MTSSTISMSDHNTVNNKDNQQSSSKDELIRKIKTNLFKGERERAAKIIKQIRKAKNFEDFLAKTVSIIGQNLKADRVLIYQFEERGDEGRIIAESIAEGWTPTIDEILPCSSFGGQKILDYQAKGLLAIEDIEQSRLTPYQKQLLEKFQVQASVSIPITLNSFSLETDDYAANKVWGLLVVQQCSKPRSWEEEEINLIDRIAHELTIVVEKNQPGFQFGYQQDILGKINLEMQELMQDSLHQIRESLKVDRALVYAFNPDWSGQILTESVGSNWSKAGSSFDFDYFLKTDEYKPYYVVNDIYTKGFARCFIETLEALQTKAYIVVPIEYNNQLLGVLGIYQNSNSRNWQKSEVNQVVKQATKFAFPLQQTLFLRNSKFQTKQMENAIQREKGLSKMLERMQIASDEKAIFQVATQEGRKLLQADRLAVYRFNDDWSGEFIAESVASGWSKLIESIPIVKDTFLQENQGGRYKFGECFAVDDIYLVGHQSCHIELLEQFEARAYAIAPIFIGDMLTDKKLWGLVAVYQNSGSRKWKKEEIEVLRQIGLQVGIGIQKSQQSEQLRKAVVRQKNLARIVDGMQNASSLENVLEIAAQETRKLLEVERSSIYRFNSDWTGANVVESPIDNDFKSFQASCFQATFAKNPYPYLRNNQGGSYKNGESDVVNDISKSRLEQRLIEVLTKLDIKAYVRMPIFVDQKLWGIINIYQSQTRFWEEDDIQFLKQIVVQIGIVIQQKQYLQELQTKAKQEKAISSIVQRISSSLKLQEIFRTATQQVRKLLEVDRAVVYRFNPDWSGEVLAESAGSEWISIMEIQDTDQTLFSTEMNANEQCTLKNMKEGSALDKDTYFINSQGGDYTRGKQFNVVNDVYAAGFSSCYLQSLEKYQARAYIIVPIFQDTKLWGLFGVYQNSGARDWEVNELNLLLKIAPQLGIAIEQAEKADQLRIQSENLAQTLAREKAAKEQLQKQAVDMLRTVRPAFTGDLTVRAKVTENEIGTIAGAYNTTLDSLKQIVVQVQEAVGQVAQTTQVSSGVVENLSFKSQKQMQELEKALNKVKATIEASNTTTKKAQKVEVAIQQADRTVKEGDRAMNKTVDSIVGIRQTVADAGKRVKRLSDSSQKISRVVNLISSFAAQTNLLALNAALEATRAGEYGKGFAVVADEVRNLSLQSSEATTEIEKLVREIQDETQEVAAAMEAGVQQVAEGTSLVNDTRDSLNEIVAATNEIRTLVQDISTAASEQTQQAESVTQVMGQVAEIANETSNESQKISASFQQLEKLANNLQSSVAQFKVN
ncbi:MAG: GAF domain-containing protein [Xenococcaceae cyanobacterium MO_207.B15]|nr:GAF domain-containing protein [Xenococcaceae cyanobacterium MO_207.B15]